MKKLNRRGFLKSGLTGATVLAVSPVLGSTMKQIEENNIIYRTLGSTGLKVPVVSFGVMRADNPGLCKAAYEKGIRFFDTAHGYQNGNNETMLGNLLKDYPRDSFVLATKVKPATTREGKPGDQTSVEDFLSKFDTSLSRLRMDYVDILYVHDISTTEMLEFKPIINAARKLKKDGKARFIGFSTHRNEHLVISTAASQKIWDVILTSYNFKHGSINELNDAIKKAAAAGIGIVAMKTMAGGGFLDKEKTKPINTSAALKWVLSNPDITTTIPGMTAFEHLDKNLKVLADISLTEQEKNDLVAVIDNPGMYCIGCMNCLQSCDKKLPVPDLMRAYMYAYGYSNPAQAKSLLAETAVYTDPCRNCDSCSVVCSRNFDVREKITDITRLVNVPDEFLA